MIRPPHPLLALLWREADAVTGGVRTLRRGEQAVAALTANPVTPLAEHAAIAWAFEAPGGAAAIVRSLARLRAANAAPAAGHAPFGPSDQEQGFGLAADTLPDDIPSAGGAGGLNTRPEISAIKPGFTEVGPLNPAAPARDAISALTEATRRAAHRPIGGSAVSAAAQRAIDLILDGVRPPAAVLLAAIDMAVDEPPASASPPMAEQVTHALRAGLAGVDAARGAQAISVAAPAQFEPAPPDSSRLSISAASGFRRLAARFAQPAPDPAGNPLAGMQRAIPALTIDAPAGAAPHRQSAPVFPQAPQPDATAPRFSVPRQVGEDVAAEAEVAELLARVLRREARRQGIVDDGGAA
jgi:hypothetical protein